MPLPEPCGRLPLAARRGAWFHVKHRRIPDSYRHRGAAVTITRPRQTETPGPRDRGAVGSGAALAGWPRARGGARLGAEGLGPFGGHGGDDPRRHCEHEAAHQA